MDAPTGSEADAKVLVIVHCRRRSGNQLDLVLLDLACTRTRLLVPLHIEVPLVVLGLEYKWCGQADVGHRIVTMTGSCNAELVIGIEDVEARGAVLRRPVDPVPSGNGSGFHEAGSWQYLDEINGTQQMPHCAGCAVNILDVECNHRSLDIDP